MFPVVLTVLVVMNVLAFALMGIDKVKAKAGAWRIPEKTLFLLSALGGSIGAMVGMRVWRHKTLHASFRYGIPAIFIAQTLLAGVLLYLCR